MSIELTAEAFRIFIFRGVGGAGHLLHQKAMTIAIRDLMFA